MAFKNERDAAGKWQTVDSERDAVLTRMSGPNIDGYYQCELRLNDIPIRFEGTSGAKIYGAQKPSLTRQYDMNWKIHRLYIPEPFQDQKEEIKGIIMNALKVYGWNWHTEKAHSVSVEFLT